MAMRNMDEGGDPAERMAEPFGPVQIDPMIRSVDEVETQIRRMVERALRDFREDRRAFGGPDDA